MPIKLVVYGTLKQGESAEYLMHPGKKIKDIAIEGYTMYGGYGYPRVQHTGDTAVIFGELWEVDETCIESLDAYEGHPDLFKRTTVRGHPDTYIYEYNYHIEENSPIRESGIW